MENIVNHVDGSFKIYDLSKSVLTSLKQPLGTIIDFGARHGESYETFSQFKPKRYLMVEPNQKCCDIIKKKKLNNVELVEGIICGDDATRDWDDLYTFEKDLDQSSNLFSDRQGQYGNFKKERVPLIKASMLNCDEIDFCKINIESGEFDLIELPFFQQIKSFVMEAHNELKSGFSYKDVIEKLKNDYIMTSYGSLSYKYCFIVGFRI